MVSVNVRSDANELTLSCERSACVSPNSLLSAVIILDTSMSCALVSGFRPITSKRKMMGSTVDCFSAFAMLSFSGANCDCTYSRKKRVFSLCCSQ